MLNSHVERFPLMIIIAERHRYDYRELAVLSQRQSYISGEYMNHDSPGTRCGKFTPRLSL